MHAYIYILKNKDMKIYKNSKKKNHKNIESLV